MNEYRPAQRLVGKDLPVPLLFGVLAVALMCLLWEGVGTLVGATVTPSQIATSLSAYVGNQHFASHVGATFARVGVGALIGSVGFPLGVLLMLYPFGRALATLLFPASYSTSKVAVLYFLISVFGIYEVSKVALVAWAVFVFLVIISAQEAKAVLFAREGEAAGVLDSALNWGLTRREFFRHVLLGECLPALFRGLRFGLTTSFMILVVSESSGTRLGLGYLVYLAYTDVDIPGLIASTLLLMVACCATWWVVWVVEKWTLRRRGMVRTQF